MSDNSVAFQIFPTSPSTHFSKVDDIQTTPNDDTDYVYCNTTAPAILDMFNITNHTTETGVINYIQVFSRARAHPVGQAPTGEYKHKITCGAGNALSPNYAPLSTAYQSYSTIFTTNPATGIAWTWANIDALIAGLSCSSPTVTSLSQSIFRPNGTSSFTWDGYTGASSSYACINEEASDEDLSVIYGHSGGGSVCLFNIPVHTTETGVISDVTIFFRGRMTTALAGHLLSVAVNVLGSEIWGTEHQPATTYTTWSQAFTTRPAGGAWTWADIDNLKLAIKTRTYSSGLAYVTQLYAVVNYSFTASPEIRTTQQYIVVNYSPSTSTVTLIAPNKVRLSNTRKTQRFIFPDGTYCIGDYGRSSKKLSLAGTENESAIQGMRAVKAMLSNQSPVTLSGMQDVNQDIQWRLNSFDFEYDIGGDHYNWTAELSSYDYVEGAP